MKLETYKCDVCGVQKQESNHWLKGYLIDSGRINSAEAVKGKTVGAMIIPWDVKEFSRPWNAVALLPEPDAHLCGPGHALEWMSKQVC